MSKFAIGERVDKASEGHEGGIVCAVFPTVEGNFRYAVDMEDRPVDIDSRPVPVAEDGKGDADQQSDQERARKQEALPDVCQVAHGRRLLEGPPGGGPSDSFLLS